MRHRDANWDYFYEVMVTIPGLAAMFDDTRSDTPGELAYRRTRGAQARPESDRDAFSPARNGSPEPGRGNGDAGGSVADKLEKRARGAADAVKAGTERASDALNDSYESIKEFIKDNT